MSNVIPPLLSNSPPPIIGSLEEEDEDEFGDFTSAVDLSYNCEALSLPPSPLHSPLDGQSKNLDINSNTSNKINELKGFSFVNNSYFTPIDKDYQDKRKNCDNNSAILSEKPSEIEVNLTQIEVSERPVDAVNSCNDIDLSEIDTVPIDNVSMGKQDSLVARNAEIKSEINLPVPDCIECTNSIEDSSSKTISDLGNVPSFVLPILNDSVDKEVQSDVFSKPLKSDVVNGANVEVAELYLTEEPPDLTLAEFEFGEFTENLFAEKANSLSPENNLSYVSNSNAKPNSSYLSTQDEAVDGTSSIIAQNGVGINYSEKLDDSNSNSLGQSHFKVAQHQQSSKSHTFNDDEFVEANSDRKFSALDDNQKSCVDDSQNTVNKSHNTNCDFEKEEGNNFASFANFGEETEDVDKFYDFQDATAVSKVALSSNDDFTDFHGASDADFGDFDDYTQNPAAADFANFESAAASVTTDSSLLIVDGKNVLEKAEKIIVDMFPVCPQSCNDAEIGNFIQNLMLKEIKDITETNALTYQWTKSSSQDNLLKALNIDTRNILYGPGWNPSMPKFAANLSFAPLEPVKSDILTPTPMSSVTLNPSRSSQQSPTIFSSIQPEVPTAQFDWSGSGLTNPLDYTQASTMLLDLEQLVASLDITSTSPLTPLVPSPSDDFDEWEFWLKSLHKDIKDNLSSNVQVNHELPQTPTNNFELLPARLHGDNESVSSLQFTTDVSQEVEETKTKQPVEENAVTENDFDNFTSYQSSKVDVPLKWSPNAVPLRETYISSEQDVEPGWLKPTILTPDLPRKTQDVKNDFDEDFTDFQMSLPAPAAAAQSVTTAAEPDGASCTKSEFVFPANILQPVTILEPLKPTLLQPQTSTESTQINWPAPGITEDDIRNIELSYSSRRSNEELQTKQDTTPKTKEPKLNRQENLTLQSESQKVKLGTQSKHSSTDDDDWSEFVCNPEPIKPSKTHFASFNQQERSATPELQLSIPQLTHLQPPKAPIPVITPQGLIQTKIPTNVQTRHANYHQPSVPVALHRFHSNDCFRPSIISNQYQNHFNGPTFNKPILQPSYYNVVSATSSAHVKNGYSSHTKPPAQKASTVKKDDDDDWTDFISSPPVQTSKQQNGLTSMQQDFEWNSRGPQFSNWSSALAPNIITNPVHYDSYRSSSYVPQGSDVMTSKMSSKKVTNVSLQSKRSTVPSISALPDLDFVAPNSRTFTKK